MSYNLNDAVIIGITGTVGKTSTAYLVHEYLKHIGKKSILYSSLGIDSPYSGQAKTIEHEFLKGMDEFANILNEALAYEAEYIVLEINEISIPFTSEIPFDIKVLTNFNAFENIHLLPEQLYQKKLAFFQNEEDAICLFNIKSDRLPDFVSDSHATNVVLYDSQGPSLAHNRTYQEFFNTANRYLKVDNINKVKYYPYARVPGLEESSMTVHIPNYNFRIETTLITEKHLENIMSAIATLCELNVFDITAFQGFISNPDLIIPGRLQDHQWNGRNIIVDYDTAEGLKWISNLKTEYNRLIVVTGERGDHCAGNASIISQHPEYTFGRDYSLLANYINNYADSVIVTTDDINDETVENLTQGLASNLTIPYTIIGDRKEAIRQAILTSRMNDIIVITWRGNRRIFRTGYDTAELFRDYDIAKQAIQEYKDTIENAD